MLIHILATWSSKSGGNSGDGGGNLLIHNIFYLKSKVYIEKSEADIVRQNALAVRLSPSNLAGENLTQFAELPEFIEVFESFHVPFIVGKNLIKHSITILKSTCMHRHYKHSGVELCGIIHQKTVSIRNTRYHHIGSLYKLIHRIANYESSVRNMLIMFYYPFSLILIAF